MPYTGQSSDSLDHLTLHLGMTAATSLPRRRVGSVSGCSFSLLARSSSCLHGADVRTDSKMDTIISAYASAALALSTDEAEPPCSQLPLRAHTAPTASSSAGNMSPGSWATHGLLSVWRRRLEPLYNPSAPYHAVFGKALTEL
jgi:hypothetical protein